MSWDIWMLNLYENFSEDDETHKIKNCRQRELNNNPRILESYNLESHPCRDMGTYPISVFPPLDIQSMWVVVVSLIQSSAGRCRNDPCCWDLRDLTAKIAREKINGSSL